MAKYLPTIDLHASGMTSALLNGQLKLQSGQWIRCGTGPLSRFNCVSNRGYIDAYHGSTSGEAGARYLHAKKIQKLTSKMNQANRAFESAKRALREAQQELWKAVNA